MNKIGAPGDHGNPSSSPGSYNDRTEMQEQESEKERKERLAKQLQKVVCICKGIPLGKVLKGLSDSETVEDVNRKVGTGSGGCAGERCGPRIKKLLQKKKQN